MASLLLEFSLVGPAIQTYSRAVAVYLFVLLTALFSCCWGSQTRAKTNTKLLLFRTISSFFNLFSVGLDGHIILESIILQNAVGQELQHCYSLQNKQAQLWYNHQVKIKKLDQWSALEEDEYPTKQTMFWINYYKTNRAFLSL